MMLQVELDLLILLLVGEDIFMRFSITNQTFYASDLDFGSDMPSDAMSITTDQANRFYIAVNSSRHVYLSDGELTISDISPGKYYTWDTDNNIWVLSDSAEQQQKEDQISEANNEMNGLIAQANDYMNSKQWPGKAALGRLTDTEKAQYNLWLDYLDDLEAVNTSSAPDIDWPIQPEK